MAEQVEARQWRVLQEDVGVQHLVGAADDIGNDALALLDAGDNERHLAAMSLDIELGDDAERTAIVAAVVRAVRHASAAFRGAVDAQRPTHRVHLAVYPRGPDS